MIPLNYHHLYYFWVTVKRGSITKAAAELLLTQPTLSMQIHQLEKALKRELLIRGRGGVTLTAAGRRVFHHCEAIFSEGEALRRDVEEGAEKGGVLRIGISTALSREVILRILAAINRPGRDLRTTVFTGSLAGLEERMGRRVLDLAVSEVDLAPALGRDFTSRLVDAVPIRFVAAPRLRRALRVFPPRGAELRMLLRTPENPVRKAVDEYFKRRRVVVAVAAETDDSDLIRIMAAQGEGVAALSSLAVQKDLASGRLCALGADPTGIKEFVWFAAGVRPDPNPVLREILGGLMTRFSLRSSSAPELL